MTGMGIKKSDKHVFGELRRIIEQLRHGQSTPER
jgi:hypothetical protein